MGGYVRVGQARLSRLYSAPFPSLPRRQPLFGRGWTSNWHALSVTVALPSLPRHQRLFGRGWTSNWYAPTVTVALPSLSLRQTHFGFGCTPNWGVTDSNSCLAFGTRACLWVLTEEALRHFLSALFGPTNFPLGPVCVCECWLRRHSGTSSPPSLAQQTPFSDSPLPSPPPKTVWSRLNSKLGRQWQ